MENKIITLEQDNGKKLAIRFKKTSIYLLEHDIKRITGWRSSTKKYDSIYHRFTSQGSCMYNYIIGELNKIGW